MMCPVCGAQTIVVDTRGTRRRRECFNEHRFSTEEVVVTNKRATHAGEVPLSTGEPGSPSGANSRGCAR